ncbi:hypothetical protein CRM22_002055 [Opisthorchis felineus]|uniref:Ubiquitin-like protease family profile domain-containing protein n=1 Tax=Opisthorchis felineus TaxID=147828 RepID=A0A4S2MDT5_OPIFE|nr:hypothetical protein CRM22_002055 [Opisthorchis felineus]
MKRPHELTAVFDTDSSQYLPPSGFSFSHPTTTKRIRTDRLYPNTIHFFRSAQMSIYERIFKSPGRQSTTDPNALPKGRVCGGGTENDTFVRPVGIPRRPVSLTPGSEGNILNELTVVKQHSVSTENLAWPPRSTGGNVAQPVLSSTPSAKLLTTPNNSIPKTQDATPIERQLYRRLLTQAALSTPPVNRKHWDEGRPKATNTLTIVIDDNEPTSGGQTSVITRCAISPIRFPHEHATSSLSANEDLSLCRITKADGITEVADQEARAWLKSCEQTPYLSEVWLANLTTSYQSKAKQRERERQLAEAKLQHWEKQRVADHKRRMDNLEQRLACLLLTPPVLSDPYLVPQPIPIELPYRPRKVLPVLPALPELTESQLAEVDSALRGEGPDVVLVENFRLSVTRRELRTLSGTNWLSDMVINFYMQLLYNRSQQSTAPNGFDVLSKLPRIAVMSTFFYPKLTAPTGGGYSSVRRWSRQLELCDQDLVLIPIHDRGMHWCLVCVDLRRKTLTYYDSMGSKNDNCLRTLMSYLQSEWQDKKGQPLPDPESWTLINSEDSVPQQMNGSDCGVFTCTYGEFLSRDAKLTFSQDDMPGIRKRMMYEILTQQLLTTGFKVQSSVS